MEESLCGGKIVWSKVKRAASAVQWMEELSSALLLSCAPTPYQLTPVTQNSTYYTTSEFCCQQM